jgi:hypothetical protein
MATKRKKLTILEKGKIIHEVENNPNKPAIEIVQTFLEGNDVHIVFFECCHRREYLY